MSSQEGLHEGLEEPWGQLVSVSGGSEAERVPIVGEKFTVGRSKDTDHIIENNKCVSGVHCILSRDENGRIWLQDTSTNGTLVNGNTVHKSQVLITDGALIRIVFRKDLPELNLSYQFNDLSSTTTDSQTTIDMTLEYEENDNTDLPNLKRKSDELQESCPKRPALDTESTVTTVTNKEAGPDGKEETGERREVSPPPKPASLDKKDSIEETLICQICQEILHDCVSLQPCMHSYCAGCYSDWMECSRECPACRNEVERISRNHIVNNLVDAYLRAYPDKKRPEEDLKELDERNKITKDMLYPKKTTPRYDDDYSSSSSSSDSTADYPSCGVPSISHLIPSSFSLLPSPIPPPFAPIPISCRQCPGHAHPPVTAPSVFVCTPSTNHILCMCCLQPMPDRRSDPDLSVPPQKCDVCGRAFCHMYWGCGKFGCRGCLNLFKDMDFDDAVMTYIINNNHYESKILKNYLTSKELTVKDLLQECLAKLDSGTFTSSDTRTSRISSSSRTCNQCALKNLQDLTYQYRQGIPSDELPGDVVSRSDCYYGKNCRTQKHNPEHCKKYNHICDQTRY